MKKIRESQGSPSFPILAEAIAFAFWPEYEKKEEGWGTYYGPMWASQNEEGNLVTYPSLYDVNAEKLRYWCERARCSHHPILRARYADLVWDLSRKIEGSTCPHDLPRIMIDATLELALGYPEDQKST